MKKLFFVSIFTLLFLCITSMAVAEWEFTQLTNNSDKDRYPKINDSGQVVWERYWISDDYLDDGNEAIYYDGSTITQLTDNSYSEYKIQISDSGQVVWHGVVDGDNEITYYDGSTIDLPHLVVPILVRERLLI